MKRSGAVIALVLVIGILAVACTSPTNSSHSSSSANHDAMDNGAAMEIVHASYLDLAGNIADLRTRVDQWSKGDDASHNIAKEKLERIEIVLAATTWHPTMNGAVGKVKAAVAPMKNSLESKNQTQAIDVAKTFGDASHDVTHAFYGDWLPALKGQHFSTMAPHAIYLDLNANIADLKTRIAAWEKGDESSHNIAKEKVERIQALVQHGLTTGIIVKPINAIGASIAPVSAALDRKDVAGATAALKPLSDAAHDLTHDFYAWLKVTAGSNDPACAQAAYLDVSINLADLKARVTAWEQGDASSFNIAQEKLERLEIVLAHSKWSPPLTGAIQKISKALPELTQAFHHSSPALSQQALKPISDASHDVTHAFYGDFLPQAYKAGFVTTHADSQTGHSTGAVAVTQTTSTHSESDSHGHSAEPAPASNPDKGVILAGFLGVNLAVIVTAGVTKRRAAKK